MKKIICIIGIICIGCIAKSSKNISKAAIKAQCERIIIMDSIDYKTINFVVSFRNESDNNIVLFANSCYKKTIENSYKNAGVILRKGDFVTPIGLYLPKVIYIKPKDTKNFIYSFSEKYPNKWIQIYDRNNSRNQLTNIAENATLSYKYDPTEMQKIFEIPEIQKLEAKTVNEDFEILMQNARIEYRNDLTMEEVLKISGGKVKTIGE